MSFEQDTAVRPDPGGGWVADLRSRWNVGNNPNGGYLLAIAVKAMIADAGRPDPVTVTAHYLSPPSEGPVSDPDPDRQARADPSSPSWPSWCRETASGSGSWAPSGTSPSGGDRRGSAPALPISRRRMSAAVSAI